MISISDRGKLQWSCYFPRVIMRKHCLQYKQLHCSYATPGPLRKSLAKSTQDHCSGRAVSEHVLQSVKDNLVPGVIPKSMIITLSRGKIQGPSYRKQTAYACRQWKPPCVVTWSTVPIPAKTGTAIHCPSNSQAYRFIRKGSEHTCTSKLLQIIDSYKVTQQ